MAAAAIADRDASGAKRGRWAPYGLLSPGVLWLALFFLFPLSTLVRISLSERPASRADLPSFAWKWSNYSDALSTYGDHFRRSFWYAAIATVACILIGYPLAYVIAFRGGRYRNVLLGLVVVPFFTSFLIRTFAWRTILGNEGPVIELLRGVGLLSERGVLLRTTVAVVGGLTYNFLPFMVLPIYVALEKIDVALVDAAKDLYSSSARAFRKVVLPLSMPGVFAGSLLTFIPASGDFVNAFFLGGPQHQMIGNVVQNRFLVQGDFPAAAALGVILMLIITIAVLVYAKVLGTEELAA